MAKKNNHSGEIKAELKCNWIVNIPDEELNEKNARKIINFYLFHTSLTDVCAIGVPLSQYGWSDPWRTEGLNARMASEATSDSFFVKAPAIEDMADSLTEAGLLQFPPLSFEEKVCSYCGKDSQYLSVLAHIRNCLAHGRFRIYRQGRGYDVFWIFEDKTTSGNVSARMVIKQRTLLKWIERIITGP